MMESHEPAAQPFGSEDRGGRRLLSMFLPLLLVLLLAGGIRYRLLDVPLERDEGEYAYAGRLILDGVPPYQGIYNMKLPGTYASDRHSWKAPSRN